MVASDDMVKYLKKVDCEIFIDKFSKQIKHLTDTVGHIGYRPPRDNDDRFYYRKGRWMSGDQLITSSGTLVGTAISESFPEWKVLLDVLDREHPITFKELCSNKLPLTVTDNKEVRREFKWFIEWGLALELYSKQHVFRRTVISADKHVRIARREHNKVRKQNRG